MTIKASAQEFQRNIGEYQDKARRGLVEITRHGRRDLVLMSAEHYDWLQAALKRSFRAEETPDFILEAIKRSRMDPRHRHLDKLMK
jgi:prevent-host-death family protein